MNPDCSVVPDISRPDPAPAASAVQVLAAVVTDVLAVVAEHLARPQPHLGAVAPGHAAAAAVFGAVVGGSLWGAI